MKNRSWTVQIFIAALLGTVAFVTLTKVDAFESLMHLSREHESWELDEIILAIWIFLIEGLLLSVYNLYHSVRKQRQQNQELKVAKEQAEELSRLKSNFLSMISHELRTPLTSINGFAKLISKSIDEISGCTECGEDVSLRIRRICDNAQIIITEGDKLALLINNVLDLAKIEAGSFEWESRPTSLAEVLTTSIEATKELFVEKGLRLELDIEPNLPAITVDFDRLVQVCVNLLYNAAKFTPAGKVTCRLFRQGQRLLVQIEDSGVGIPAEKRELIFDRFSQLGDVLTDKPQGTGLGLPICKEIIKHHGGQIWCEGNEALGSTFTFAIPVEDSHDQG